MTPRTHDPVFGPFSEGEGLVSFEVPDYYLYTNQSDVTRDPVTHLVERHVYDDACETVAGGRVESVCRILDQHVDDVGRLNALPSELLPDEVPDVEADLARIARRIEDSPRACRKCLHVFETRGPDQRAKFIVGEAQV